MYSNKQITNLNLKASARNLIMGRGWIFHEDNDPKQTSKSTQKMCYRAQNEAPTMTVPVP